MTVMATYTICAFSLNARQVHMRYRPSFKYASMCAVSSPQHHHASSFKYQPMICLYDNLLRMCIDQPHILNTRGID